MTDKQIIIDGVDVCGCKFFQKEYIEDYFENEDCNVKIENFCCVNQCECEKDEDCYFKQLKRLQFLLKEAREVLEYYKNSALDEKQVFEKTDDGNYLIPSNGLERIHPIKYYYLKYDKETAEQMIKKIDEVL